MALGYCAVWQVKFYATKSFFNGMDVKINNIWYVGSTLELQMSPQYNYDLLLIIMYNYFIIRTSSTKMSKPN